MYRSPHGGGATLRRRARQRTRPQARHGKVVRDRNAPGSRQPRRRHPVDHRRAARARRRHRRPTDLGGGRAHRPRCEAASDRRRRRLSSVGEEGVLVVDGSTAEPTRSAAAARSATAASRATTVKVDEADRPRCPRPSLRRSPPRRPDLAPRSWPWSRTCRQPTVKRQVMSRRPRPPRRARPARLPPRRPRTTPPSTSLTLTLPHRQSRRRRPPARRPQARRTQARRTQARRPPAR